MPTDRELIRASLDSGADEPSVEARAAMLRVLHGARLSHTVIELPRAAADSPAATIPAENQTLAERILSTCNKYDDHDLFWRTGKRWNPGPCEPDEFSKPASFFVNCNDLFYWGCADLEEITAENVDEFEKAYADCFEAGGKDYSSTVYAQSLFVCRVRKMRPQGAAYPQPEWLWPLFDACGPERQVDAGNPKPQPKSISTIPAEPFPLNAETAPAPIDGFESLAQGRLQTPFNAPPSPAVATSDM